jgi:hypothetical protein
MWCAIYGIPKRRMLPDVRQIGHSSGRTGSRRLTCPAANQGGLDGGRDTGSVDRAGRSLHVWKSADLGTEPLTSVLRGVDSFGTTVEGSQQGSLTFYPWSTIREIVLQTE